MPYRDPATRKAYARRKSREHYVRHRQQYIDRAAARKRHIRKSAKEWDMTTAKTCPKCGGPMTKEEVGGRRHWDCEKADCSGRILLDKPTQAAHLSDDTLAAMARPKLELTLPQTTMDESPPARAQAKTYGNGKMPALSEDGRRRIGEGVRKAAEERRRLKQDTHETPVQVRIAQPVPPQTTRTGRLTSATPSPIAALEEALLQLETQAESLTTQLSANHAKQDALRKAASILRAVETV